MEGLEILDIAKEAIIILLKVSAPILLTSLVVGLIISLFQALTQIQEATLTFVPKILAVFASIIIFSSFIATNLQTLFSMVIDKISFIQ